MAAAVKSILSPIQIGFWIAKANHARPIDFGCIFAQIKPTLTTPNLAGLKAATPAFVARTAIATQNFMIVST